MDADMRDAPRRVSGYLILEALTRENFVAWCGQLILHRCEWRYWFEVDLRGWEPKIETGLPVYHDPFTGDELYRGRDIHSRICILGRDAARSKDRECLDTSMRPHLAWEFRKGSHARRGWRVVDAYLEISRLTPREFSEHFDRLLMPADDWATMLGIRGRDFQRWRQSMLSGGYHLPGFFDPLFVGSREARELFRGVDIKYAMELSALPVEAA